MHAVVLRYFDETARRGSIRKAAEALNVASSAVNRQILKLEHELGTSLFDRSADGVSLTAAGEILVRHARNTLYEFERAKSDIEDLKGLKSGHVTISSLGSLLVEFLPAVINDFNLVHPAVTYSITDQRPNEVVDAVATGEADVGLCFLQHANPLVHAVAEINTPLRMIVSPKHPLATRRFVRLEECARYPLILTYDSQLLSEAVKTELSAAAPMLMPRLTSNALDVVKQSVVANLGVAFLTGIGLKKELHDGSLVAIPLVQTKLSELRLHVIVPARKELPLAASVFVEHLTRRLNKLEMP